MKSWIERAVLCTALSSSMGTAFAQSSKVVALSTKEEFLRHSISVTVDRLDLLLNQTKAANTKPVLFLDGREIKGVYGVMHNPPDADGRGTLFFDLDRTADNRDAWKPLLSRPNLKGRTARLSIGVPGGIPILSDLDFTLDLLHVGWFAGWVGLLVCIALPFLSPRTRSLVLNVLRESGPLPAGAPPGALAAYSLGRCQMAFWFVIVVLAYVFLYMVTWDYDTITTGTLTLMGISAGTAFAGATVDSGKASSMTAERGQLSVELNSGTASAARQIEINKRIAEIDKQTATPLHTDWLTDLLTDANGMSFHRLQLFVWTIILGVIFVMSVYNDLLMPDFSGTLLGLMGISAGTYVGFKFPENKN